MTQLVYNIQADTGQSQLQRIPFQKNFETKWQENTRWGKPKQGLLRKSFHIQDDGLLLLLRILQL